MNFLPYRHRKLSEVVPVPEGLRELMADVTREVLRYQPENIEAFIADYLEAMLLTRELCSIADRTIEDVLDSSLQIVEILQNDGILLHQAESVVKVMKEEFKNHIEDMSEDEPLKEMDIVNRLINECGLTTDQALKASEVIENSWCHYYQRNKNQPVKYNHEIAHHEAVKNTLSIYQKSKATCSELNKSEKVLQPGFKGYFTRKLQTTKENSDENVSRSLKSNWRNPNFQNREQAAIKIQSWFRGLKDRKQYKTIVKAVTVIQAGFKGFKTRKELKLHPPRKSSQRGSEKIFDDQTREKAATKIQSFFRAYKVRKTLKIQQKAATVIQAHFRDFINRKKIQNNN